MATQEKKQPRYPLEWGDGGRIARMLKEKRGNGSAVTTGHIMRYANGDHRQVAPDVDATIREFLEKKAATKKTVKVF